MNTKRNKYAAGRNEYAAGLAIRVDLFANCYETYVHEATHISSITAGGYRLAGYLQWLSRPVDPMYTKPNKSTSRLSRPLRQLKGVKAVM